MKKYSLLFLLLICYGKLFAQQTGLAQLLSLQDSLYHRLPVEKVYMQLDKPSYILGDTIHFKSYLLNADFLTPSTRSRLLYVDLDNENGKAVTHIMIPVVSGLGWGDIVLKEEGIHEGSYTLTAYTNWMRNFGEDYLFKKDIYISRANNSTTLIKADFKLIKGSDKDVIQANLRFTSLDKKAMALRDMQLRVTNANHSLAKEKLTTGIDGSLNLNFDLADKSALKNLAIQAMQTGAGADTTKFIIPVTINRSENTDVQFMPEGGNLIAGITTKVGFKAISEDGKGADISGSIYNSKQQEVTQLRSAYKGMGNFEFTPQAGENYTAKVNLPGGMIKNYALPVVNPSGTTLSIANKGNDSVEVTLHTTADLLHKTYYLVAQARNVVCYGATVTFKDPTIKITIDKDFFPSGIARFTLLNTQNQPLNERMFYIDRLNDLTINVSANKQNYSARDSVALNITVTNKAGKPVQGAFSLAVTDGGQVRTDTLAGNILSNLLLTSDLKGTIEEPAYYLKSNHNEALDNLLLTQGWIGYDWKQITVVKTPPTQFEAEPEYIIHGNVTGFLNKPMENTKLSLLSQKPLFTADTLTGKNGQYTFKRIFPEDSSVFIIQAKKKNGSPNVSISVDDLKPSVLINADNRTLPWYVNTDTVLINNLKSNLTQNITIEKLQYSGKLLKEVKINDKKIINGSHNLNGPGQADIILETTDLEKQHKKSLLDLLQSRYRDFHVRIGFNGDQYFFRLHRVVLVIDGFFVRKIQIPIETYMNSITADNVKGIEIMYSTNYAIAYDPNMLGKKGFLPEESIPVFFEITTYDGQGAYINKVPNLLVYKPMPFTLPKQFYRPRYTIKNVSANPGTDLRSTIHWEPNIITDKNGKATVSFYTSDRPNDYTVVVEGSDMNGNVGSVIKKLTASKNTP